MRVTSVLADPVRSLAGAELSLNPGITAITGANGSGKTNLLESLYFGLTGRSFRTSDRRDLIPHGGGIARARVVVLDRDGNESTFLAAVSRAEGRRHLLDGNPIDPVTAVRHRPHIAVFAPDRLQLIKGPPSERRSHLDAFTAARWPTRTELRRRFGQALAQRNAMLARIAGGRAGVAALDSWDHTLAAAAAALISAREQSVAVLAPQFTELAGDLGLPGEARLEYAPRACGNSEEIAAGLEQRRRSDLDLGRTGWGPHLDEIRVDMDGRSVRRYGSQGQQRTALLALLLAERAALAQGHGATPLLLLDDVMSELDPEHRDLLGSRLRGEGQTLITAADATVLPTSAREGSFLLSGDGELEPA